MKLWYKIIVFTLIFSPALAQNAKLPPRIPQTGIELALADYKQLDKIKQLYTRYIWVYGEPEDTYAAYVLLLNSIINRHSRDYIPEIAANGALIRLDFRNMAADLHTAVILMAIWDDLSFRDPYFSAVVIDKTSKNKITIPAPYLGLTYKPGFIYRSDWLLKQISQANDGCFYYKFLGITPGKTTKTQYLKSRNAEINDEVIEASSMDISEVSKKVRKIVYWQSKNVQATKGQSVSFITQDIFDNNNDPAFNPFSSVLDNKFDGEELMVKRPNGYWEFTLWDANGNLVVEAPPNLVIDSSVPKGHTNRLTPAISCISCHGPNRLIQPFHNQIGKLLDGPALVLQDNSSEDDFRNKQKIRSQFSATDLEINNLLDNERDSIDNRLFLGTKLLKNRYRTIETCSIISAIYNKYEYEFINAKVACLEYGVVPPKDDVTGVNTLRTILPLNILGPESINLIKLEQDWFDPVTNDIKYGRLTRREYEIIYQVGMIKALPAIKELNK